MKKTELNSLGRLLFCLVYLATAFSACNPGGPDGGSNDCVSLLGARSTACDGNKNGTSESYFGVVEVSAIAANPGGEVFIGSDSTNLPSLAKFALDGSHMAEFQPDTDNVRAAVAVPSLGNQDAGSHPLYAAARNTVMLFLASTGAAFPTWVAPTHDGIILHAHRAASNFGVNALVAGTFTTFNGSAARYLAIVDYAGNLASTPAANNPLPGPALAAAMDPTGHATQRYYAIVTESTGKKLVVWGDDAGTLAYLTPSCLTNRDLLSAAFSHTNATGAALAVGTDTGVCVMNRDGTLKYFLTTPAAAKSVSTTPIIANYRDAYLYVGGPGYAQKHWLDNGERLEFNPQF